eukprot:CAMPEP_0184480448 /NCGR_PEP_ID=MMETSP0113_2-20130426/1947_1 /TAXON_ID=91329 /ORGANISM="Norrisiella sphaerica, Strain BC52" /LENGTH=310 /DNA_ID=CAMNT_0026858941 /DNA_START=150 /DNA_END=1082 /DNA_ORIENTATION=-
MAPQATAAASPLTTVTSVRMPPIIPHATAATRGSRLMPSAMMKRVASPDVSDSSVSMHVDRLHHHHHHLQHRHYHHLQPLEQLRYNPRRHFRLHPVQKPVFTPAQGHKKRVTLVRAGFVDSLLSGFGKGLFDSVPFNSDGRIKQLVELARQSDRGRNALRNAEMKKLIDDLRAHMAPLGLARLKKAVNGSWVEMWTTEDAVLTFARKGFFGSNFDFAGGSINMFEGKFTNIVAFEDRKSLEADGLISVDEENNRVSFRFDIAKVNFGNVQIPLPFSAGGYIDNVYVDDKYRIGVDSRGDYRVYRRPNVPP